MHTDDSDNKPSDRPARAIRLEAFRATLKSSKSVEQAAKSAGVSLRTATRWKQLIEDKEIQRMSRDAEAPIEISELDTTEGVLQALKKLVAYGSDTAKKGAAELLLEHYRDNAIAGEYDCPGCARVYPDTQTWVSAERALDAIVPRAVPQAIQAWIDAQPAELAQSTEPGEPPK